MVTKDMLIGAAVTAVAGGVLAIGGLFINLDSETRDTLGLPPAPTPSVAESPAASFCHDGWKYGEAKDADTVVMVCERGDWIVYLNSEGGFSHALQKNTAGARFIYEEVNPLLRMAGW